MSFQGIKNRSVCSVFLAQLEAAMVSKAMALSSSPSSPERTFALAVLRDSTKESESHSLLIASDIDISAVPPSIAFNGNGDTYGVDDSLLVSVVERMWSTLSEL